MSVRIKERRPARCRRRTARAGAGRGRARAAAATGSGGQREAGDEQEGQRGAAAEDGSPWRATSCRGLTWGARSASAGWYDRLSALRVRARLERGQPSRPARIHTRLHAPDRVALRTGGGTRERVEASSKQAGSEAAARGGLYGRRSSWPRADLHPARSRRRRSPSSPSRPGGRPQRSRRRTTASRGLSRAAPA